MADKTLDEMTVGEIDSLLDKYDADRISLKEKAKEAMQVRNRKIQEENAAEYGLNTEQYQQAKTLAAEKEVPIHQVIRSARKKVLQSTKAKSVEIEGSATDK